MIVNTQISGGGAKTYLVVTVTGEGTDMVGGTVTATSVTYNNVSYTGTTNMKYTTDVLNDSMRSAWVSYKHAVRQTQEAVGYPTSVTYPTTPE